MDVQTLASAASIAAEAISTATNAIDIAMIPDLDVTRGMESLVPSADIGDWYRRIVGLFDLVSK